VYEEPFRAYLYTPAWVERVIKEIGTVEEYRAFYGRDPRMKVSQIPSRWPADAQAMSASVDQPA
jgi:hypothetical protein